MSILQQQTKHCTFCNKEHKEHTEKLWNLHKSAVDTTLKSTRHKKIWSMQLGFGPTCKAVLSNDFEYDKGYLLAEWLKPIYMPCSECGHYLGKIEEDHADVLDSLCLECFKQLTGLEENTSPLGVGYPKEIKPVRNIWSGKMVSMGPIESTGRFYSHPYSNQDILDRVKEKKARKMTDQPGGCGE